MWKDYYGQMVWRYYNAEGKSIICISGVYSSNPDADIDHWSGTVTSNGLKKMGCIKSQNLEILKLKCLIAAKELGWKIESF